MKTVGMRWLLVGAVALGTQGCANAMWMMMGTLVRFHSDGERVERKDLNFRFTHPGRPWFDSPERNKDAAVTMMRFGPIVNFSLIAEEGEDLTVDHAELAKRSEANLRGVARDARFTAPQPARVGNIDGVAFFADARVEKSSLTYAYFVSAHNGFLYQLILSGPVGEREEVRAEARELAARFEVLEPARMSSRITTRPLGRFESPHFHYVFDPGATLFRTYPDVAKNIDGAELGGLSRDDASGFAIIPLRHGSPRPRPDALHRAALYAMGFEARDASVKPVGVARELSPGVTEQVFSAARTNEKTSWTYRLRILSTPEEAFFTWVWSTGNQQALATTADTVFAAVSHSPERALALEPVPDSVEDNQAMLLNQVALYYSESKQFPQACGYLSAAHGRARSNQRVFGNLMGCLMSSKDHASALAAYEAAPEELKKVDALRAWKAWHVNAQGKREEAAGIFKELFAAGHQDDEDFNQYVTILEDLHRDDEAALAWDGYLALRPSPRLRVQQSAWMYRRGRHEDALTMLQRAQKGVPFDTELAYARMAHLHKLGRNQEVMALADEVIANGFESAEAHFWKGRAQMRLEQYRNAKASFEKSLKLNPNDEDVEEWLRHVSAGLGEGNNSSIKTELAPIALPPTLRAELDALGPDPAAKATSYDWRIEGFSFERGKRLRSTVYRRVRIRDERGATRFQTLDFDFSPLSERIFVNTLVVTDAKGQVVGRGNVDDFYVVDHADNPEATHDRTLRVPVPQLAPGHTLEFVVTRERTGAPEEFAYEETLLTSTRPVRVAAVFYEGDPSLIRYETQHQEPPEKLENGLLFVARLPQTIAEEPMEVMATRHLPTVRISDAKAGWPGLAREYAVSVKEMMLPDEEAARVAREVTSTAKTRNERISLLLAHVQKKVTYRAIEFGVRGMRPNKAAKTLEQGYGDCKDHTVLLHQLLKAVNIPSHVALIHTRTDLHESLPSLAQFNHMILYIPEGKAGRFIDATDKEFDPAMVTPTGLAGRKAWVLSEKPLFITVPPYGDNDSTATVLRTVKLGSTGELDVTEELQLSGYIANFTRTHLRRVDDGQGQRSWAQEVLAFTAQGALLQDLQVEKLDDNGAPLVLKIRYKVPGGATRDDGRVHLTLPNTWERYYLNALPVAERKSQFHIEFPFRYQSTTVVETPPDVRLAADGASGGGKVSSAEWSVTRKLEKGQAVIELGVRWKPGTYPAADYALYQGVLSEASRAVTGVRGTTAGSGTLSRAD